jgi:hypothetical protein
MNKDLCDRAEKGLLWFDEQQFKAKRGFGSLEHAYDRLRSHIEDTSAQLAFSYKFEVEYSLQLAGLGTDERFLINKLQKPGNAHGKMLFSYLDCDPPLFTSTIPIPRVKRDFPVDIAFKAYCKVRKLWPDLSDRSAEFNSKVITECFNSMGIKDAKIKAVPLADALISADSLPDLSPWVERPYVAELDTLRTVDKGAKTVNVVANCSVEYALHCHATKYAEQLSKVCACDLICSDETELMLLDSSLANDILCSKNETLLMADLQYLPFNRTFIEFDKPVTLVRGVDAIAVGMVKQGDYRGVCWFHDLDIPDSKWFKADISKPVVPPFTGVTVVMFTMAGKLYVTSNVPEVVRWCNQMSNDERAAILMKSRNIWDFATCRNIDYEVRHRGQINCSASNRPKHLRSRVKLIRREYRIVKVEGKTTRYGGMAGNHNTLEYQISIPGTFHKWIYCKECGDTHRHDLIGCPCRKCGLQVGPIANITIKKFWHGPHLRGPADAPFVETARELIRK